MERRGPWSPRACEGYDRHRGIGSTADSHNPPSRRTPCRTPESLRTRSQGRRTSAHRTHWTAYVGDEKEVVGDLRSPPAILLAGAAIHVLGKNEDDVLLLHHIIEFLHGERIDASRGMRRQPSIVWPTLARFPQRRPRGH